MRQGNPDPLMHALQKPHPFQTESSWQNGAAPPPTSHPKPSPIPHKCCLQNFLVVVPSVTDGTPSAENGINNTKYASQDAALPDIGGDQAGHPAQKHASCAETCKPGSNQDTAVGKGTSQASRPIAAGRPHVTR